MSPQLEPQTAQILDFTQFRLRRAARRGRGPGPKRQFLWSWPATGHIALIDFPADTPGRDRQGSADPLAR